MFGFSPFAVTGYAALPQQTSYSLNADTGSYTITGNNASFVYFRILSASAGSYTITGQNAVFLSSHVLTGNTGSYTITGQDAALNYNPSVLTNLETLIKLRSFTEHRRF